MQKLQTPVAIKTKKTNLFVQTKTQTTEKMAKSVKLKIPTPTSF